MMKPALQLRMGQSLTMTPQLQQAIRLLQLSALDLQAQIREALESNVMLEAEDENEGLPSLEELADAGVAAPDDGPEREDETPTVEIGDDWQEPTAAAGDSSYGGDDDERGLEFADQSGGTLAEHLGWQLELARLCPRDRTIGRAIVDAVNEDGYLGETVDGLVEMLRPEFDDIEAADVEAVLGVVQQFDPPGIAARNVAECIELQLRQLAPDTPGLALAIRIARERLEMLAAQQIAALRRELDCRGDELELAIALVRSCHPRPGTSIATGTTEYVVPDVFVRRNGGGWIVELNPAAMPRVRLNQGYAGMVTRAADHSMLRAQLQEARWLLRSLEIRNDTMLRVARTIVERQAAFLDEGEESMQPMVLKDVAEAVQMHESTISRVTTGKYMHTPRGVFEFRFFFSSHVAGDGGAEVSSTAIRAKIRRLIAGENPQEPLSDSRIAELLSSDGVQVARRTVAKYREALGLAPSSERRKAALA